MRPSRLRWLTSGVTACLLGAAAASAQPATQQEPSAPAERQNSGPGPAAGAEPATGPTGFWDRPNLFGDPGGPRAALADRGLTFGLTETSEVFGNPTGGVGHGVAYDGGTLMGLGIDTAKAFRWEGGTFNVSAFQIHGRNLSAEHLATLQTASGIEATRATRLWELWYQQSFLGGRLDVKLGQQSLDQEFMTSQGSNLFINTAMGWAVLPSVDLYAGGPAYPLASLGVRVRAQLSSALTVLGGVFDDNPPGGPFYNDSQARGAAQSGTSFNTGTGALVIGELQYALNPAPGAGQTPTSSPASNAPPPAPGLPGLYKLGFWYDSAAFPDQRSNAAGLSLANPASSGGARLRRHNFSIYAVGDQTVWRPAPDAARAVGVFARVMGSPADRNLVDLSVNAGLTLKAPIAGRDSDTVGLGFGYAHVSRTAAGLDRDVALYSGAPYPVRSSEKILELTYQAQVTGWWIIQPDAQYVFDPGAGVANPTNTKTRVKDELVLGLRTNLTF